MQETLRQLVRSRPFGDPPYFGEQKLGEGLPGQGGP